MPKKRVSTSKKQANRNPFFLVFSLVVFLVFAASVYFFYSGRVWNYEGRFNVLNTDSLTLTSYYGAEGEKIIVRFWPDAYIESEEFGKYKFRDLVKLAETVGKKEDILKKAATQILGVPVDETEKNLGFWDKAGIWLKEKQQKRIPRELDLEKMPLYEEEELIDGSKIYQMMPDKVDFYLSGIFLEKEIREENMKIGIFNASDVVGLAGKTARVIENIGGKVVVMENYQTLEKKCFLETRPELLTKKTVKRLKKIFPNCSLREKEIDPRYDLVVIIR